MSPYTFLAQIKGYEQDVAQLRPEILQAMQALMELVEEQEGLIRTMLAVNKKLLDRKK